MIDRRLLGTNPSIEIREFRIAAHSVAIFHYTKARLIYLGELFMLKYKPPPLTRAGF